jgi:hypothetical protein
VSDEVAAAGKLSEALQTVERAGGYWRSAS